jgi:hypothetical protein
MRHLALRENVGAGCRKRGPLGRLQPADCRGGHRKTVRRPQNRPRGAPPSHPDDGVAGAAQAQPQNVPHALETKTSTGAPLDHKITVPGPAPPPQAL